MRKCKQIFAVLLVVMIMFTTMPSLGLKAMAQALGDILPQKSENSVSIDAGDNAIAQTPTKRPTLQASASNNKIIYTKDGVITRAEWLHNLVVTLDMTVDSTALPDNYFSDLSESHKYYADILLAVEFGVVNVAAGEELRPDDAVTRDFAASTLNFCLGYQLEENVQYTFSDSEDCQDSISAQVAINCGWFNLVDNKFNPETLITDDEITAMLDDANSVLQNSVIDEYYESTYNFAEDVIVIPDGTEVLEDENGAITIIDCPQKIKTADKFDAAEKRGKLWVF